MRASSSAFFTLVGSILCTTPCTFFTGRSTGLSHIDWMLSFRCCISFAIVSRRFEEWS